MRVSVRLLAGSVRRSLIKLGESVEVRKRFTPADMQAFAQLTGDYNPIHLDPEYAAKHSRFGKCIVYGVLMNGYGMVLRLRSRPAASCPSGEIDQRVELNYCQFPRRRA